MVLAGPAQVEHVHSLESWDHQVRSESGIRGLGTERRLAIRDLKRSDGRVLARGALVTVSSRGATGVLQLVTQVLAARLLGPASLGVWAVSLTVVRAIGILAASGVSQSIVRFGPGESAGPPLSASGTVRSLIRWGIVLGILGAAFLFLAADWLGVDLFREPALAPVLRIMAPALAALAIIEVLAASTVLTRKMHYSAIARDLGPASLHLCLILICVVASLGLIGVSIATSLAFVLAVGVAWLVARRASISEPEIGFDIPGESQTLSYAAVATLAALFGFVITRADLLFVGFFLDSTSAGQYMAAIQFSLIFAVVLAAFSSIFAPLCSELYRNGETDRLRSLYRASTRWGLYLTVPVIIPMLMAAPEVLELVYGREYVTATTALRLLLVAQLVQVSAGLVYTLMMMAGGERLWLRLLGAAALVASSLPVLLIPRLGMNGAALATVATAILLMGSGLLVIRSRLHISPYDRRSLPVVLCAAASVAAVLVIRSVLPLDSVPGLISAFVGSILVSYMVLVRFALHAEDRELLAILQKWSGRHVQT